jgi:hypothetical protein
MAAGKRDEADALLKKSLEADDPFVQYMSLTVMVEASRR